MRILYVGPLWSGGTCLQRMQAMQDLGNEIIPVDTEPDEVWNKQKQLVYRIWRKIFGSTDLAKVNNKIIHLIRENAIDVLWLDKAQTIAPETFKKVRDSSPKAVIAGYSPDDMAAKHNQSRSFLKSLPLYDVFFTTKSYGVKELEALGVSRAIFIGNAYDPQTHRPMKISKDGKKRFGGQVGFIGAYEVERAQSIHYLASQGIPVRIWGPNWGKKCRLNHPNMKIEGKPVWGKEYAKAICSFDVNLVFLRKINRDLQTSRSMEIPACGGFMLAEQTDEHLELFEKGKEAEFFENENELLDKTNYYLFHSKERKKIAAAGRKRCLKSGYSNQDRIREMFAHISERFGIR